MTNTCRVTASVVGRWILAASVLVPLLLVAPASAQLNEEGVSTYNEGLALMNKGQYDEAIGHFMAVLQIDPNYANAYFALGYAQELKGNLADAKASYTKAIELDPKNAKALYRSAALDLRNGNPVVAARGLKRAVEADSTLTDAWIALGTASSEQGQWADAISALKTGLAMDPKNADAYFRLGNAYYRQASAANPPAGPDEYEPAANGFLKSLELNPKHANAAVAHYYLGLIRYKQGRDEDALKHFVSAGELDPKMEQAFYRQGKTLEKLNRVNEAITALNRAVELKPGYGAAHYTLGRLYQRQKRDKEAMEAFRLAAADASFPQRRNAQEAADNIADYLKRKAEQAKKIAEEGE